MKYCLFIPTYKRNRELLTLLRQVEQAEPGLTVFIKDDLRNNEIDFSDINLNIEYTQNRYHRGKEKYYRTWNDFFAIARASQFDAFFCLADDFTIDREFFRSGIKALKDTNANAVTLTIEKERAMAKNWTGINPTIEYHNDNRYIKSNWFDLCGVISRKALQNFSYKIDNIDESRWRVNKNLGSGVGKEISIEMVEGGLYQTPKSYAFHSNSKSVMNEKARYSQNLTTYDMPEIIVGITTYHKRLDILPQCLNSIAPYVDEIRIATSEKELNGKQINIELPCKLSIIIDDQANGDNGKFFALQGIEKDCYFLTIDDDLIYPPDYVSKMIQKIEQYNRRAIVSALGRIMIQPPINSYYSTKNRRHYFHTFEHTKKDQRCQILGTGVMGWHSSAYKPNIEDFKKPNMADIYMGLVAQRDKIPMIAIEKPANWLYHLPITESIFDSHKNNDKAQTEAFNSIKQWRIYK